MSQFIFAILYHFSMILALKVIIKDRSGWSKELVYFIPILILGGLFVEITSILSLGNLLVLFFLAAFLYFKKGYSVPKTIILASVAHLISTITINGNSLFLVLLFPEWMDLRYAHWYGYPLYFLLVNFAVLLGVSHLFVRKTEKIRHKINENVDYQLLLANLLVILLVAFDNTILVTSLQNVNLRYFQIWLFFFALVFISLFLLGFILYMRSVENKKYVQRKKEEQQALLQYTREIEKQSRSMWKFKHDYQNILTSLEGFIDEKDYEGLTVYFKEKIITVSRNITDQDFTLSRLELVKITEIKSILVSKVIIAQEHNLLIHLEIRKAIDNAPMDSIALVRMLGIILDNAIEELIQVQKANLEGALLIGIWEEEDEITFVVQNTCRPTTFKVHQLQQNGFSTKGEGRGSGLNNLLELSEENPNAFLETSIVNNQFIQKITIGG